ncbi:hypothetical protein [Streptomyces sp. CT34]|uniref:hypothetical protein n=1 Tax=Streptomyces sp. CT34 TaxID=1553907 RepID=UPI0005BDAD0E|nr:hypothetical protein [Streptomyces sp. CT34]
MRTRLPSLSGVGATWSAKRRLAIVALVITGLLALAATVALFTGGDEDHDQAPAPSASSSIAPSQDAPQPSSGAGQVAKPPQLSEPVAYAKAVAAMLWSYDTRHTSRDQQLAGMRVWMTQEAKYADWNSVAAQVPDPVLWSRMADNGQHAVAKIGEGHFPAAFKQALSDDPSAITKAYVYVVTVNGTQQIAWKGGGGGAEDRSVTLAVQCRPGHDCALAALAPRVVP